MATVIDALIITLGFDTKGLKQGQAESNKAIDDTKKKTKELTDQEKKRDTEIKKRHEENKKRTKETSDGFKTLSKDALAFFGVITTSMGMAKFIGDLTNSNAKLERTATNLDSTTETLSAWGGAVEQMGGNAQEAISTMQMLSQSMTQILLTGESANLPFLRQLGVDMNVARKSAEPLAAIILQMAEGAKRNEATAGRATAFNMLRMAGVDEGMANLMFKSNQEIALMLRHQKEIGVVQTDNARRSQELARQWVELTQRGKSLGLDIESYTTPALTKLLKNLMDFGKENPNIILGIGAIATAMLTKFAPVRAMLVGISGILAVDDWATWSKGGESAFGKLAASAKQFWHAFNGTFDESSQNKLDAKTTDWMKRYLNNINAMFFGGDTKSTVGKKTTKEIKYLKSDDEIISDLIKGGMSKEDAAKQLKSYEKEVGRRSNVKGSRINALFDIRSQDEVIENDKRNARETNNMTNVRAAEKRASLPSSYNNSSTSTSTNSTTVGQVVIYTQATDAQGIANAFPRALANQSESGAF